MKKYSFFLLLAIICLMSIGATKLPFPVPGEYSGKIVNIGDDFFKGDFLLQRGNDAVLMDSKPEEITIDPEIKLNHPKYGSILLGDNDKRTYFMMDQDTDGYWMNFYLDQNQDYKIIASEKITNLEKWDPQKVDKKWDLMESSVTNDPIAMAVPYKNSQGEIKKKLSFYLWIKCFSRPGEGEQTFVTFATASTFEGFIKLLIGKDEKLVKYRITDANCNGCFNDYGKDYLYLDLNFDGYFSKKEAVPLYEFFDQKVGKTRTQMRLLIPACPLKIAVAPAVENDDTLRLEAPSDSF